MKVFKEVSWDSNKHVDETVSKLFKKKFKSKVNKKNSTNKKTNNNETQIQQTKKVTLKKVKKKMKKQKKLKNLKTSSNNVQTSTNYVSITKPKRHNVTTVVDSSVNPNYKANKSKKQIKNKNTREKNIKTREKVLLKTSNQKGPFKNKKAPKQNPREKNKMLAQKLKAKKTKTDSDLPNENIEQPLLKKNKNKNLSHQTLFVKNSFKAKAKINKQKQFSNKVKGVIKNQLNEANPEKKQKFDKLPPQLMSTYTFSRNKKSKIAKPPLHVRMLDVISGGRFRYLNEQIYTSTGKEAKKFFEKEPDAYNAYHLGYKRQVETWPLNPLDVIIKKVRKLPKAYVIADFGCGEAHLAKSVPHKVHSFDLVSLNDSVVACDMAQVPLSSDSVDVVVFCLSLMGTNINDYLKEATRVLKNKGLLKIAEVESRFEDVEAFVKNLQQFGFACTAKDLSHSLFYFFDFVKKGTLLKKLPVISLKPCLYKKR